MKNYSDKEEEEIGLVKRCTIRCTMISFTIPPPSLILHLIPFYHVIILYDRVRILESYNGDRERVCLINLARERTFINYLSFLFLSLIFFFFTFNKHAKAHCPRWSRRNAKEISIAGSILACI